MKNVLQTVAIIIFTVIATVMVLIIMATSSGKDDEQVRQGAIDSCMQQAYNNYISSWDKECKTSGTDKKVAGCRLPTYLADSFESTKTNAENICVTRYK